jgi:hypothetical protein
MRYRALRAALRPGDTVAIFGLFLTKAALRAVGDLTGRSWLRAGSECHLGVHRFAAPRTTRVPEIRSSSAGRQRKPIIGNTNTSEKNATK